MSADKIITQAFGKGANLYTTVLGISCSISDTSSITGSQLRKSYYRRALLYHPDKQNRSKTTENSINDAKCKFQAVSLAYSILSNPKSRKDYDETKELFDDEHDFSSTNVWKEYFSNIFGTISNDDIDTFTLRYKCSEEEKEDVLKYYVEFEGNLHKILECVMCSTDIDKKRWIQDYIEPAIQSGIVPDYSIVIKRTSRKSKSSEKVKKLDKKKVKYTSKTQNKVITVKKVKYTISEEAEKEKKKKSINDNLFNLMKQKSMERKKFQSRFSLEKIERLCNSHGSRNGKKKNENITDEDFLQIRARLGARKKSKV